MQPMVEPADAGNFFRVFGHMHFHADELVDDLRVSGAALETPSMLDFTWVSSVSS